MFPLYLWLAGIPIFCFGMFGFLFHVPLHSFPTHPLYFMAWIAGGMILCMMEPESNWDIVLPQKWRLFRKWAAHSLVVVGAALFVAPMIYRIQHPAHEIEGIISLAIAAIFYSWNAKPRQLLITI